MIVQFTSTLRCSYLHYLQVGCKFASPAFLAFQMSSISSAFLFGALEKLILCMVLSFKLAGRLTFYLFRKTNKNKFSAPFGLSFQGFSSCFCYNMQKCLVSFTDLVNFKSIYNPLKLVEFRWVLFALINMSLIVYFSWLCNTVSVQHGTLIQKWWYLVSVSANSKPKNESI